MEIMFNFLFRGYYVPAPMCDKAIKWLVSPNYAPSGGQTVRRSDGQIFSEKI